MTLRNHKVMYTLPTSDQSSPWSVIMISRMLIIETFLLFFLGLFHVLTGEMIHNLHITFLWFLRRLSIAYSPPLCGIFWFLSSWATVTSVLFLKRKPAAWLHAVSLQGVILAFMILRYYTAKPVYSYFIMIYAAWLVVYLHYSEVESVFHAPAPSQDRIMQ